VFTTLFVAVSQAQTKAFPKGGNPSSVGKYFLLPVKQLVRHQSFAAIHSHNTLGTVLPISLTRKQHRANGNSFFRILGLIFPVLQSLS
jgi:hypothetical protein